MLHKLADYLYLGLWAIFATCLAMAGGLLVLHIDSLPSVVENIQIDSYDTILSVKWMGEYGMFGNVPYFSAPYSLFGNWPVLFAFLGSLLNIIVRDPSLATAILYWAIEIAIAFLIWTRFLKHCELPVKAAFIILFLFNLALGNIFPFGYRKRQQLAILVGLLMFLTERLPLELLFGFLAILAQPFTGILLVVLKAAHKLEKKNLTALWALMIPLILSYPFYSNLLGLDKLQPQYSGCFFITQSAYLQIQIMFVLAVILFCIHNRKKLGFVEFASLGMALFHFAGLLSFMLIKDLAPLDVTEKLLQLLSSACEGNFYNVAALGLMISLFLKNTQMPKAAIALTLLLGLNSVLIIQSVFFNAPDEAAFGANILQTLESRNVTMVKGMEVNAMQYGGSVRFKPAMPLFGLQGYALLNEKNMTFVDEFNMPPQLSKGGTNVPMAQLPEAIYHRDFNSCREMVGQMRSAGVQALIYILDNDMTLASDFNQSVFVDNASLRECNLSLVLNYTSRGYADYVGLIYKIQ